jgi:guanine deaminase
VRTTTRLESAMTPREEGDSLRRLFEKYIMTGDDRNVANVYVRGRRVAGTDEK